MSQAVLLSFTVRAGRLLRLLGWLTLAFTVSIGATMAIPTLVKGDPFSQKAVVALAVALTIAVIYLVVGAGVKRYRPWAKVAGVLVAVLSLANVPIGSVIGGIALFYMIRGWREQPSAA